VLVVVTPWRGAAPCPAEDVADSYRRRWPAALARRSLKVTLGMGVLRCQSRAVVRKEGWAHFLASDRIRAVMAPAAQAHGTGPRGLSFKGALQALTAFAGRLLEAEGETAEGL
jgi:hypothetical protein